MAADLRDAFLRLTTASKRAWVTGVDYRLGASDGKAFPALAADGALALVIPLAREPGHVARTASGCVLRPGSRVRFEHSETTWVQPAAALECRAPELIEAFIVLASDVSGRIAGFTSEVDWQDVVTIVDEWLELLSRPGRMSSEGELGLWGEVNFIKRSDNIDRLVAAWLGPERGQADFVIAGAAAEIKTTRHRLMHFVSQAQVERPFGDFEAYFVSMWVGVDPEGGTSLPQLIDDVLLRCSEPAAFLRHLLQAGYSPGNRASYVSAFRLLEEPIWFGVDAVPRVRTADEGVSDLRYRVHLDEVRRLTATAEAHAREGFGQSLLRLSPVMEGEG